MKIEAAREDVFKPITLTIRLDTQEEADALELIAYNHNAISMYLNEWRDIEECWEDFTQQDDVLKRIWLALYDLKEKK